MGPPKKIKMSKQTEHILQNSSESRAQLYLCNLPNEILAKIYQYLSPVDLLSLAQLDQRFVEMISCLKEANFSSCRKVNFAVSSLFSKLNVKHIQMLNFNYNIFVRPLELAELISRCKNLKKLSVVECGIKYNHIIKILQSCTKLEELSWDISHADETLSASCPTLKILHLFYVKDVKDISIYLTIMNFPQIKNIFIHFEPDFLVAYPYHGAWLRSFIKSSECSRSYIVTNGSSLLIDHSELFHMLSFERESETDSSDNEDPDDVQEDVQEEVRYFVGIENRSFFRENRAYSCSSDLQFHSEEKDISSLLSSGLFNAYSSVSIIVHAGIMDFHVSKSLVQCVKKVAGDKLKYLTLQFETNRRTDEYSLASQSVSPLSYKICEVVSIILLSCPNITVLNIANVHFHKFSPFSAICQLQNLRTLNMPSCCFENYHSTRISWGQNYEFNFLMSPSMNNLEEVVKSCPKVENLSLVCCEISSYEISEDRMNFVKEWKELKHLTIYNTTFRTFKFLRRIADSCKQLESLSLISGVSFNRAACLFTDDVIYVLKTAKNLSFLRINDPRFNPMFERFFGSIEEAVNLEGICILTRSEVHIVNKIILKAIRKLKYLHLFHFCHPRVSEKLYSEVKKSMNSYGVRNMKIESNCMAPNHFIMHNGASHHHQPNISCRHMHLKNIDF